MQIGNCVGKRHHFTRLLGGKVQRVIVTINLGGGDILHFDKAVKPTPGDGTVIDSAPQELPPPRKDVGGDNDF